MDASLYHYVASSHGWRTSTLGENSICISVYINLAFPFDRYKYVRDEGVRLVRKSLFVWIGRLGWECKTKADIEWEYVRDSESGKSETRLCCC